ncbi:MAG: tRNA (cytidine/uridine-2'-O-)-methyltransferase TrmJ [Alphaproteobacteria bacterium]|nr:MAG: tRNA (cytidine/uridine-2'-O-)-methyltransferase TrmJ [Alphaproteobacteria bacterium]
MSGTDTTRQMLAGGPAIVLVEPQLGENIGMVARAMANFGLSQLRLVAPRDGWPNRKAKSAASGADHVIEAATVHPDLASAVADLRFVYATTARQRDMIKPVVGPAEAAARLRGLVEGGTACGVLFGRERWGLRNEEVALADALVTYPVNPRFASLNLAQAVLLIAYEWMKSAGDAAAAFQPPQVPQASRQDLIGLIEHLEAALDEADYFHPPEKRDKMALNLRNIFTHAALSEPEVRTLRGVIAALERRWAKGRRQG